MSAEAIARVVRDFRRGTVQVITSDGELDTSVGAIEARWGAGLTAGLIDAEVVDVTAIYHAHQADAGGWMIYDESVCRPPLVNALYAWADRIGGVHAGHGMTVHRDHERFPTLAWQPTDVEHSIDWTAVEWVTSIAMWVGGYSQTLQAYKPTIGPIGIVMLAINADGRLQDVHWLRPDFVHVLDRIDGQEIDLVEQLQTYAAVVTRALTFLNCRNVLILEPHRPRPEARRIARTGVIVNEIHVTPIGSYSKGKPKQGPVPLSTSGPLTPVRGHIAHYGCCGRDGLLFGKIRGEFWIPQHHRGSTDAGTVSHEYEVTS